MTDMFKGDDAGLIDIELIEAAEAVIARWDSPRWKWDQHTGEFIARLRRAVEAARRPTDDAALVKGARVLDSEGLADKLTIGHPDAYLNAIFDFGAGLLAQWIAKGLQAADVVDGVKHLESAARGLHALAARGAGQGEAVATAWADGFMAGVGRRPWEDCADWAAVTGVGYAAGDALPSTMPEQVLFASPPLGWTGGWKQVGEAGAMPGSNGGFTMAAFKASDVPEGAQLYVALPAAPSQGESVSDDVIDRVATAVMVCVTPHLKHMISYSNLWTAVRSALLAPQPSASDGEG